MARRPSLSRRLKELLANQGAILEASFLEAIADLRDGVDFPALVRALERGDIEGAIAALNLEAAAFVPYVQAKTGAYAAAGALTVQYIPPPPDTRMVFRFDLSNPRAEAWIAENVGRMITGPSGIIEQETQSVRRAILAGYSRGEGPQTIARTIAGRVDRVTGRRAGGLVGLSGPQEQWLENMRARLASGDPVEMSKVFKMTLRDKRYDGILQRAIDAGRPVSAADLEKMAARYADRLLKRRAEDIARTETAQAVEAARKEGFMQSLAKSGYPEEAVSREWVHGGGKEDARPDHAAMHGQIRHGFTDPFVMDDGSAKVHALDGVGGAAQDANCRCSTRWIIDYTYGLE